MTTPSTTRPPSSMCPCTNYYDSDDRPSTAMQHHHQQQAAPPAFFTHVVYRDRSDSDIDASQSGSSLPSENTVITSVTNSTDSTPLHSLPGVGEGEGAGPGRPPERGDHSDSHQVHHHHYPHHGAAARRSQSYSLGGSGSPAQYASVNSLSAAYHRPTYAFGSTLK